MKEAAIEHYQANVIEIQDKQRYNWLMHASATRSGV
jgi:hypothetical protein